MFDRNFGGVGIVQRAMVEFVVVVINVAPDLMFKFSWQIVIQQVDLLFH
jgi:hypothetical protein